MDFNKYFKTKYQCQSNLPYKTTHILGV